MASHHTKKIANISYDLKGYSVFGPRPPLYTCLPLPFHVSDSHASFPAAPQSTRHALSLSPLLPRSLCGLLCRSDLSSPIRPVVAVPSQHTQIPTHSRCAPETSVMLYVDFTSTGKKGVNGHAVRTILEGLIFLRHNRADLIPFKGVTLTSRLEICKCNFF